MELGCPQDEYDPEIARILPAIAECRNVAAVSSMVKSVFSQMFDEDMAGRFPDWDKLANEIWQILGVKRTPTRG